MKTTSQFSHTTFIINPRSGLLGGKRNIIHLIDRIWGTDNGRYSILVTTRRREGERLARQEVQQGCDLIVVVGGDGTLNEVVRGTLGSQTCIGLIPAGSGNGFARHWNIPLDLEQACQSLLTSRIVHCDVGIAAEHLFLVTFGCGLDAMISDRYARSTVRGMSSYFYHGFWSFLHYQSQETSVRVNGQIEYSGQPLLLTLANARGYGGGTVIAPQARADDGLLDLCILNPLSLKTCLIHIQSLFNGQIQKISGYRHTQIEEAIIERSQSAPIHVDGEPYVGNREIRISVLPGTLPFLIPA